VRELGIDPVPVTVTTETVVAGPEHVPDVTVEKSRYVTLPVGLNAVPVPKLAESLTVPPTLMLVCDVVVAIVGLVLVTVTRKLPLLAECVVSAPGT
jgi:hypothetical protein